MGTLLIVHLDFSSRTISSSNQIMSTTAATVNGEYSAVRVFNNRCCRVEHLQHLQSTLILFIFFLVNRTLLSFPSPIFFSFLSSFLSFQICMVCISLYFPIVSSPKSHPAASPIQLAAGLVILVFYSRSRSLPLDFQCRACVSISFIFFVVVAGLSGVLGFFSLRWGDFGWRVAVRGFTVGLFYGIWYLYQKRWVLEFPIIQHPSFYRYKLGVPLAAHRALMLSVATYFFSAALAIFIPGESKGHMTLFMESFVLLLCWELNHHVYEVLHTERIVFAPPEGSKAEANPSEPLLAALVNKSTSRPLIQYLAYLDLLMVCENDVHSWRIAAFFEETGKTYKRVMDACLNPLELFVSKLGEVLKIKIYESLQLSNQLKSKKKLQSDLIYESFSDFQLCTWCARIVSLLTVHSHKPDRFRVAQRSGSNATAMSVLLSSLLAIEALLERTNLQSTLCPKAPSMASILRTSICRIVSTFHDDMVKSAKSGLLDKEWVTSSKYLFGTHELLLQKLLLFLE